MAFELGHTQLISFQEPFFYALCLYKGKPVIKISLHPSIFFLSKIIACCCFIEIYKSRIKIETKKVYIIVIKNNWKS